MTLVLLIVVIILLCVSVVLSRFKMQSPDYYANTGPQFDIRNCFDGPVLCEGVIFGPFGRVNSRFIAKMDGVWSKDHGVIEEVFRYADGDNHQRKWEISVKENGSFEATATDIVGVAKGRQVGSTARLQYRVRLPEASGGHILSVTDWIYLLENGTLINRSEMRKFGIKVAELVATMRPI